MNADLGLEEVAEEVLGSDYELGTAVDPRVPSMEWETNEGLYSLKVYSDEFLENDSKAVGGKTLEDVVKKEADAEDDFYVEVRVPSDSFRPDREVYTFSEEKVDEGLREVVEEY
ncbi:MAG: hypothetical protein ABEK04_03300, partial [Candidatus Nanohalobium sp.]